MLRRTTGLELKQDLASHDGFPVYLFSRIEGDETQILKAEGQAYDVFYVEPRHYAAAAEFFRAVADALDKSADNNVE